MFQLQDQVFWYLDRPINKPLMQNITTDIIVIGGGMAGLSAAQSFNHYGNKVVLIEKNYCGSGASGKSSGFITPDAELSLYDLMNTKGLTVGKRLWEFIDSGVAFIRNNIEHYNLACDYQKQDTLIIATSPKKFISAIEAEHKARERVHYESSFYTASQLPNILGSNAYYGGIAYGNTFGIHAYKYCQEMKSVLQEKGVEIYEETPAIQIDQNIVKTPYATIRADRIIVCIDQWASQLPVLTNNVYHVQTFLMMSCPLTDQQIRSIFPEKLYMVWDTDLIYNYFRITGDNRLLFGGASLWYTYANQEYHNNNFMIQKLTNYFMQKFPRSSVEFEYVWPGIIGISKDLYPIAGFDQEKPSIYYITAAAGLPWAAALGNYCAEQIINKNNEFEHYFSPYRSYKIGPWAQEILGKKLTFALSNFLTVSSL